MRLDVEVGCDVQTCKNTAVTIMSWPVEVDRPWFALCPRDEKFYRSIAGKHMTFETIEVIEPAGFKKGASS